MTQTMQRKLNDSVVARWGALILIALMMFFAYMFVDVISPISSLLETQRGWSPDVYGTVVGLTARRWRSPWVWRWPLHASA